MKNLVKQKQELEAKQLDKFRMRDKHSLDILNPVMDPKQ